MELRVKPVSCLAIPFVLSFFLDRGIFVASRLYVFCSEELIPSLKETRPRIQARSV